jgi:dymeclin
LFLYTLFQVCPSIAETMVIRSELDRLVLPLLRTLYFSSNTQTYVANDFAAAKGTHPPSTKTLNIRSCPFRSLSQLYVIIILLLLFSQDTIFGRDAFRRIRISHVPWYKERNLRGINLGSVIVLTLLRSLMFNLQRIQDNFLLSNCCAVLLNLSPSIVDIHEYTAMRLVSVTVAIMKRNTKLRTGSVRQTNEKTGSVEDMLSTPLGMYDEVAQTLLETIYHCLSPKTIERNLHLVYALVYHQADFNRGMNEKSLYPSKLLERIQSVIGEASKIIQDGVARTASKALEALEDHIELLQKTSEATKRKKVREDVAFTYEEEADPEIFFVPYVWEIIVSVVTSGTVEWKKCDIKAFALVEPSDEESTQTDGSNMESESVTGQFAKDVSEIV